MKKSMNHKKFIITTLLLILVISNFSLSFAFWASSVNGNTSSNNFDINIGMWDYEDTALVVATFRSDYAAVLSLTEETVSVTDRDAVEEALNAFGLLSDAAKTELIPERDLLLALLTQIIALDNSVFLDFEAYPYDQGLTGTLDIDGRTWYGNDVFISNDPAYDVWRDTRSLALRSTAYFESRDLFINGIDTITLYHGARNYNNGASFAFRVDYELGSNPGVWLTLQDGGVDLIIDVISGTPMTFVEIPVNITEAINIRFVPIISTTTDYINLDDITIFEHIVSSNLEVETYRAVYAGALALTTETVDINDKTAVLAALAAYDLLSPEAQTTLTPEKALLDSLLLEIEYQEDVEDATQLVSIAELTNEQMDLDAAQALVSLLPNGPEKTSLQNRINAVQAIIDQVDLFRLEHAFVLTLNVGTVELSDKPDIEAALDAYYLLSPGAQAELSFEKALLDDLLAEVNSQIPTETLVLEFRTDHAAALLLTTGTVQISDRLIIEQALDAYDLLTPAAQAELLAEKALLDSLLYEIMVQEATEAVVLAEGSFDQEDVNAAQVLINILPVGTEKTLLQARLDDVQNTIDSVLLFRIDYEDELTLTVETVSVTDKTAIEAALAAYGSLGEDAQTILIPERDILLGLFEAIIAFENSVFLDFEAYPYDQGLTGTLDIDGRTWYANDVFIANDPAYDVWRDTRSLALRSTAYFESRDLFINGIDKITIYHGARNYNNGASFAFRVDYELGSNPGVWLTLQEGGVDLIITVISGDPMSFSEIPVNITQAINIRFVPIISTTTDYINLDDIRVYEHVTTSALEVENYRTIYAQALALTLVDVTLGDMELVSTALAAYDLLSVDAQNALLSEKALLDSLWQEILTLEAIDLATSAVILAETTYEQTDLDAAQLLVTALDPGTEKTNLQNRIDAVQLVINAVNQFRIDHAYALSLTVLTVDPLDKPDVEAALSAYSTLSVAAKNQLLPEKALLDDLLIEINSQTPTEALVLEFRTNHAVALVLTVGTVQISDLTIVEQALAAYDLLTPEAKTELLPEKALLDSLIDQIDILEATETVVIAEGSNLQADLDAAQLLVTALPSSTEKTALQARLDAVQVIINTNAANAVDALILAIPSLGSIALSDEAEIVAARSAYNGLTVDQQALVQNLAVLVAAENELVALDLATDAVILAETSQTQNDVDAAQILVTALTDGSSKTLLQNRLNAVQDIIDVAAAQSIINIYFAENSVVVSTLNNNTVKQTAFLAKANEVTSGLGVTITVNSFVRVSRTNSTYNITITKNAASVTFVVSVTFTR